MNHTSRRLERTSFVAVYPLVQTEARPAELVDGVRVLDVIANLPANHVCGMNEPVGDKLHERLRGNGRVLGNLLGQRHVFALADSVAVARDIVEPVGLRPQNRDKTSTKQ